LIIASPFVELVAHLAGARASQLVPSCIRREGLARFHVHARSWHALQLAKHGRQRILPERRVEENHVDALPAAQNG
jgi:hypothetical protein